MDKERWYAFGVGGLCGGGDVAVLYIFLQSPFTYSLLIQTIMMFAIFLGSGIYGVKQMLKEETV